MKFLNNIFRLAVVVSLLSQIANAAVAPVAGPTPVAASMGGSATVLSAYPGYDDAYEHQVIETQEDPVESRVAALARDYGYKTATLMVLKEVAQNSELKSQLSTLGFSVTVPEFVGISDLNMKSFLSSAGLDLDARWQEVLENSNMNNPEVVQTALQTKTLPEAFIQELREFADEIGQTFECLAAKEENKEVAGWCTRLKNWASAQLFFSPEVDNFLKLMRGSKLKYAVCGSNQEDFSIVLIEKTDSKNGITKANILRAIGDYFKNYISPESAVSLIESKGLSFFDNFSWSILIQRISENSFGLSNVPEDFKADFIKVAESLSDYIFESYGDRIELELLYPFISYTSGEKLVTCKSTKKLVAEDFKRGSKYLVECNGAIEKQEQEGNVLVVVNPSLEYNKLTVERRYNVCNDLGKGISLCFKIENNQAVTACMFRRPEQSEGKGALSLVCGQYVSHGNPDQLYKVGDRDFELYSDNGIQLTNPSFSSDELIIAQEYKKLLTRPWVDRDGLGKYMEITEENAPHFYVLLKQICENIPALRKEKVKFGIIESDKYGASAGSVNGELLIVIRSQMMNIFFPNTGRFLGLISVLKHEIGHIYQHVSGEENVLPKIELDKESEENYLALVNSEINADLYEVLNLYLNDDKSLYPFVRELLAAGKDDIVCPVQPFVYKQGILTCGNHKMSIGSELTFEDPILQQGPSRVAALYGVHPETNTHRIPILLEHYKKLYELIKKLTNLIQ